jgi:hypothetical protein
MIPHFEHGKPEAAVADEGLVFGDPGEKAGYVLV